MEEEKLIYIDKDNIYASTGMTMSISASPTDNHASEIKEAFRKGIFSNFASFKNFIKEFEEKYSMFGVPENYIREATIDNDFRIENENLMIDVTGSKSKCIYIINQSNDEWNIFTTDGIYALDKGEMMITVFNRIASILDAMPWYVTKSA